ncbi:MAG: beta-galactosidase [Alicyclobacillus sp.]|nr:beta-galactosidase [Alicyclobacillus sp.]
MIDIREKKILVDGKPQLLMCGEIHYFRLSRRDWQDRLDKAKAAGCNVVASYVPWLCHEPREGELDLDGHTRPELDLGAFIDLCRDNGLYFFVRPGPFIMAEMKNEGLPYWLYEKHPEIVPVGWDGKPATTRTVDYLAPGFLQEVRKWYAAVMGRIIAPRLHQHGGNVIAVQLDNEIGMLSWASNGPDLTDHVVSDFITWLQSLYESETLQKRYPFPLDHPELVSHAIRSPKETYAAELMRDLGYYMRHRFARYVATLRNYAESYGVRDIPFVINIHGTSDGRGLTFPIGISQLYEAYTQSPGYVSGSDIYLGDLTMNNFQDLYLINSFMGAVNRPEQPLTSVEFECGDGNYGNTFGGRFDPSAADFKTRMCIAQGHRLINYYLFAGGMNYRLDQAPGDGNDRIAFTGERHGFAAPVSPEGELNYTFPRMARVIKTMRAAAEKLAVMEEEHDGVSFAFIPDYYMTEYYYPSSATMREIRDNIQFHRGQAAWEVTARAMLLAGFRFGSVDVQNGPLSPDTTPVLVLPSARYLDAGIQQKLVDYLRSGGQILLVGEVPQFDMEGNPCTVLADAFRVRPLDVRWSSHRYFLSVVANGWASPKPEVRSSFAQLFDPGPNEVVLSLYDTGEACGFESHVGQGKAVVFAAAYECDVSLFTAALARLGTKPALTHDCSHHGIFMTSAAKDGERFIHILNLDGFDKELRVYHKGQALFDGRSLHLQSRDGLMLPQNVRFGDVTVVESTAEIQSVGKAALTFRLTQPQDVIVLRTDRDVAASNEYTFTRQGDVIRITSRKHAKVDDTMMVRFQA